MPVVRVHVYFNLPSHDPTGETIRRCIVTVSRAKCISSLDATMARTARCRVLRKVLWLSWLQMFSISRRLLQVINEVSYTCT